MVIYLLKLKLNFPKIATRMIPAGQFSSGKLPSKENSHPG